ncbi:MAG: hypothetical protein BGO78_13110 [Chloroflexi bacterium 44-23]|mgnify:CR=1 FL=1|nr:MAG: hypothetical protein BGO78_13110 [Chloroflexi bacterium 44-23]
MRRLVLFWISLAFITGIIGAGWLGLRGTAFGWLVIVAFLLVGLDFVLNRCFTAYFNLRGKLPINVVLLLSCLLLGAARYSLATRTAGENELAYYNNRGVVNIEGVICQDPQLKEKSITLIVCSRAIQGNGIDRNVTGKVIIHTQPSNWQYGDLVRIRGSLSQPEDQPAFSYRDYLAQRKIYSMMTFPYIKLVEGEHGSRLLAGIYSLRKKAYDLINQFLPQPSAGLLSGILLGIENDIPASLELAFQKTGTAHIVAISGYNMTLLAGLTLQLLRKRFSLWWALLLAIITISLYTILVGAAPGVIRAALMSSLAMTAHLIGRKQAGPFTLVVTVAILCVFNPLYLWDAGFQLSVAATFGLVLYADRMAEWFTRVARQHLPDTLVEKTKGPVGEYFLFTLAAQVTTLPVILYHFERISISAFLANPLILPVQPLIMMLGGLAVFAGLLWHPIGQLLAYLVWVPLAYTIRMVSLLGRIDVGTLISGRISVIFVIFFYVLLLLFTVRQIRLPQWTALKKASAALLILTTVAILAWQAVLTGADGYLRVILLGKPDDSVQLVITPSGERIVLGCSRDVNQLSDHLATLLPVFDRHLDLVIVNCEKNAGLEGLPLLLQRFPPQRVAWLANQTDSKTSQKVVNQLQQQQIPMVQINPGAAFLLDDEVRLTQANNDEGAGTFLLAYGNFQIVLGRHPDPDWQLVGTIMVGSEDGSLFMDETYRLIPTQEMSDQIVLLSDGKQLWYKGSK